MKKQLVGGLAAMALALTACGDDGESAEGDVEEYCRLSAESLQRDTAPTPEDFEEALDAAPGEIRDDLEVIFEAFTNVEDPEDVEAFIEAFETPEVEEAIANVEEFEAENCDATTSSTEE